MIRERGEEAEDKREAAVLLRRNEQSRNHDYWLHWSMASESLSQFCTQVNLIRRCNFVVPKE
jgi:hypothetical protein